MGYSSVGRGDGPPVAGSQPPGFSEAGGDENANTLCTALACKWGNLPQASVCLILRWPARARSSLCGARMVWVPGSIRPDECEKPRTSLPAAASACS